MSQALNDEAPAGQDEGFETATVSRLQNEISASKAEEASASDSAVIQYSRGVGQSDNTPRQLRAPDFNAFRAALLADRATRKGQQWVASGFCQAPDDDAHRALPSKERAIGRPHRGACCALPRRFIAMDVDGGQTAESFVQVVLLLQAYSGLVYTTASHKPDAPRFRIVLELDMPAPRSALIQATQALRARLDRAMEAAGFEALLWDKSCDRPEQPLYLPLLDAWTCELEGKPVALGDVLTDAPLPAPAVAPAGSASSGRSNAELVARILAGVDLHDSTRDYAFRLIDDGMQPAKVVETVRGLLLSMRSTIESGRWQERYNDVPRLVSDAQAKLRGLHAVAASESQPASASPILPAFPAELLALPHGLGRLQDWIAGYMTHPSRACAGLTAFAVLAHFAMAHVKVDSRDGLGLNEQFLMLAPTGFGKEDLRKPFGKLADALEHHPRPAQAGNLWPGSLPQLQYSAPASQQGLHRLLETNRCQTLLSDEFAEWLAHAGNDGHKQQALGHLMQAYSKAFGTLAAPAVASREQAYKPIENPRVLVFATSTAERILEAVTASQADSGALNRFVILVAEQERIPKRYDVTAASYAPPYEVVDLVAWVSSLGETIVGLTPDAQALYVSYDSAVIDPLGYSDPRLAKRMGEQAFKLAALIALSDRRRTIEADDLRTAYAVREGLYHRAASLIGYDGALSGMHQTGRALEQLKARFENRQFFYRSNLPKESRQFAKLSIAERQAVERALVEQGYAHQEGAKFVSLIYGGDKREAA